jgi:hypothetical protein
VTEVTDPSVRGEIAYPRYQLPTPIKFDSSLEVEFHRRLRTQAPGVADSAGLHTSYAPQSVYDPLLCFLGPIISHDVETLRERLTLAGDPRDVLAARDSLKRLLGLPLLEG